MISNTARLNPLALQRWKTRKVPWKMHILNMYRNMIQKCRQRLRKVFSEEVEKRVPATDVWSVMDEIAQVLDGQAEYSLEPGKTLVGEDVAEYFYFENKKRIL